ncbi:MAG TPA: hypothetical protein VJQ85_02090 [Gaiellaceae bacterium]|nr:hypothetical protein [Gaiellaceae bacterium]
MRPEENAGEHVEKRGARRPRQRRRGPGRQAAEPLADPPHAERPGERGEERRPDGGSVQETQSDQQLERGRERIEQNDSRFDQVRGERHRCGDECGLPDRVRRDDRRHERASEHERLQLQCAVGEPSQSECHLEPPRSEAEGAIESEWPADHDGRPADECRISCHRAIS